MKLYLCRHGETVFNKENRLQGGAVDSPLTENGVAQARQMASFFRGKKIDAIFSSPLGRAKASASFLRKVFPVVPYFELDALKEINNGEADGLSVEETKARYPHLLKRINLEDLHSAFPGGETYEQVKERLKPFIAMLKQDYAHKAVAVMAHGGVNRMLIGLLFALPDRALVMVSVPNDVIYEIVLLRGAAKSYCIRSGKRKKGLLLKDKKM